jgi:uncharacterized protein YbjQ (UPF0145 family)
VPIDTVVRTIGQVFGLTVRSRSLGGNIAAGLKSLVGARSGPDWWFAINAMFGPA